MTDWGFVGLLGLIVFVIIAFGAVTLQQVSLYTEQEIHAECWSTFNGSWDGANCTTATNEQLAGSWCTKTHCQWM